ncbi:MAG: zinc metallopeptidase [Candidatus Melainabacteria bacterium]|nr:zinc metallopeptidase [Candidatus Melainabacteria bacterium]
MLTLLWITGIALIFLPQLWVKGVLNKYTNEPASIGKTGGAVAREILNKNGLNHVAVEVTNQGDHYDPISKAVRLSENFYSGTSLSAVTVAAHECGHAIQDAENYGFMRLRTAVTPVVQICQFGPMLLFFSLMLTAFLASPIWKLTAVVGLLMYTGIFFFQLITLPVELDASFARAVPVLEGSGYISPDEKESANKILQACAFTYIAAALFSLIEILRWALILFNSRNRD